MNERLEKMLNFIIPQLERDEHEYKHSSQEDIQNILFIRTKDNRLGHLVLHEKNTSDLNKRIQYLNNITETEEGSPLFTGHVFYKHSANELPEKERFLVSGAQFLTAWKEGMIKKRRKESLRDYDISELKDGFKLKEAELDARATDRGMFTLSYYQPETKTLSENIRYYSIKPVILNYENLDMRNPAFGRVKDHEKSKEYFFAKKISEKKEASLHGNLNKTQFMFF